MSNPNKNTMRSTGMLCFYQERIRDEKRIREKKMREIKEAKGRKELSGLVMEHIKPLLDSIEERK